MKKKTFGCLVVLIACAVIVVFGMIFFIKASTYTVETYKTREVIARGDEKILSGRFTPFHFENVTVFLEWYTYDNDRINTAPYKLFVRVDPRSPAVRSVEVLAVSVTSSRGYEYSFSPATEWPVVLSFEKSTEYAAHIFEPAFMFRFDEDESVFTRISFTISSDDGVETETIEAEWIPVRLRRVAPMV
jgi:hypothetical protein